MGEANGEIQNDPLSAVFTDPSEKNTSQELNRVKLYRSVYESGRDLGNSCGHLKASSYVTPWQEKQAKRAMASTLQYLGLDLAIKAIGPYARQLEISPDDFRRLSQNIVKNYCSKNITVFSLKTIQQSLEYYYKNPSNQVIPYLGEFYSHGFLKETSNQVSARSREFDLVLKNFRAMCSWGGEVEDYRLMIPYLNNKFIMAFVIKNMLGLKDTIDPQSKQVVVGPSEATVQVSCRDLICRHRTREDFQKNFPLSSGSTGLKTDLSKLFCHHFRFQLPSKETIPEVREWVKNAELEDPIFQTSQLIALMTGIPDFFSGAESYQDAATLAKSSIDERWNQWALNSLGDFSKQLLFEEALKIKIIPVRKVIDLSLKGPQLGFSVTLGEIDRVLQGLDKLKVSFSFKLTKNYLRSIRTRWRVLEEDIDETGKAEYLKEIARYLDIQIKQKESRFFQKVWNDEFSQILAQELVSQVQLMRGPVFNSFEEELLEIPVTFSYGLFAINYLRYKADTKAGRIQLSL